MDVRTYFYDLRTKESIFLLLTFKYDIKYKAHSEAKSLVSGLAVTNDKALFPTMRPFRYSYNVL